MKLLTQPIGFVQSIATKKIIKQFCNKFNFVYFGSVDARRDEHQLLRGVTASTEHADNHYAVGTFRGHDCIVVERHNTLHFPGKAPQPYRWLIMQIDLRRSDLPHAFIDAHHHEAVFYANLFAAHAAFQDAGQLFIHHEPLFTAECKIFAAPTDLDALNRALTPTITAMIAHHFRQFDYELDGDHILIYASNSVITLHLLQEMLRVGVWLADQFNAQPHS